jgi:hypothetical protein
MPSIVGGLDIHRKQITFDYLDTVTGEVSRGRVAPADREHFRIWLALLLPKTSSMLVGAAVRVRPMWCAIASAGHSCDGGTLWHGDRPCCCDWPTSA